MGAPIKPSKEECLLYEHYVKKSAQSDNSKILILGSTPELRDMALRFFAKPVSCDIDDRIWAAMKFCMKESGEEEFIHSDWLQISEDVKYDIIIGDGSMNMLSECSVGSFIKKIAKLTKKGGLHVQRFGTRDKKLTLQIFVEAMKDYRKNKYPISVFLYTLILVNSINNFYYPEYNKLEIFEKVLFPYLTQEEIEEVHPFLPDRKTFFPNKERVLKLFSKYFHIDRVVQSEGLIYWKTVHTYVMTRK